jgi:hypothetical protein
MGVDYNVDIKTMLSELRLFFVKTWQDKYHTQLEGLKDKGLDYFNSVVLDVYPGTAGYHILEDSFHPGNREEIDEILSVKTKEIFGYLYGIHLNK